jgi:hypothetical protein
MEIFIMNPDFAEMDIRSLRAYVLNNRNDNEAFYVLADRLKASSVSSTVYPCPDTPENLAIMEQAIQEKLGQSIQKQKG